MEDPRKTRDQMAETRQTPGAETGNTADLPPVESPEARAIRVRAALSHRFMTAVQSAPASPAQRAAVASNQRAILHAAETVVLCTEEGREQSLALTKLEEALMWANKAVFRA